MRLIPQKNDDATTTTNDMQEQQTDMTLPKRSSRLQLKDRIDYKEYSTRGIDRYNSRVINNTEEQQMM